MKKVIFSGIFSLLFIFSCQKEVQNLQNARLSTEDIELLGQNHKEYLTLGYDFIQSNSPEGIASGFLDFAPDTDKKDLEKILYLSEEKFLIEKHEDRFNNPITVEIYNSIIELSNSEITTLSSFKNDLKNLKSLAISNLNGLDKDFILLSIEVAENSASLLLPKSKGGQGLQEEIINTLYPREIARPRGDCADSIIAGAVGGAAGVFLGWGSTLIAIPGTNAAVGAAVVWGAAYGAFMGAVKGCN